VVEQRLGVCALVQKALQMGAGRPELPVTDGLLLVLHGLSSTCCVLLDWK